MTLLTAATPAVKQPWDTFPLGHYNVVVERNGEPVAVFWPSADHIGVLAVKREDAVLKPTGTLLDKTKIGNSCDGFSIFGEPWPIQNKLVISPCSEVTSQQPPGAL